MANMDERTEGDTGEDTGVDARGAAGGAAVTDRAVKKELFPLPAPLSNPKETPLISAINDPKNDPNASKDPNTLSLPAVSAVPVEVADPALKDPLVYCSGKIVFLHKLLIKLKRESSKSLIFSQFTTTLDVIQEYLTDYGYAYEVRT